MGEHATQVTVTQRAADGRERYHTQCATHYYGIDYRAETCKMILKLRRKCRAFLDEYNRTLDTPTKQE
jgi:hypothetical protein